jgi:hypothetical protein
MDSSTPNDGRAERLRLRAALWRSDAENSTSRDLRQLMLRSADELEGEAAELERYAKGIAKEKTKLGESGKEDDVLIAELDKGPLGA